MDRLCVCDVCAQMLVELRDRRKSCHELSSVVQTPTFGVLTALMDVMTQVGVGPHQTLCFYDSLLSYACARVVILCCVTQNCVF